MRRSAHPRPGAPGAILFLTFATLLVGGCAAAPAPEPADTGSWVFDDTPGTADRPVPVWYHRPEGAGPDAPFVFVIHGMGRNADGYRDAWIEDADRYGFVVVVPEFSDEHYPGSRTYNLGNVSDDEAALPESEWSFSAIEPIFDDARERLGNGSDEYVIYGHSAGSQFVHRFLMFKPDARVRLAVAANAGWYTMPTDSIAWPYGVEGLPEDFGRSGASFVRGALERPVVVLLGTADTLRTSSLRQSAEADAQGPHRFARGHAYYDAARAAAAELDVPFNWDLVTVEGVGHSNGQMAPGAAREIADALGLEPRSGPASSP